MSYDYLEDHALKNVWCAPDQDQQSIVKLTRVTPPLGVWNQVTVGWRTHTLPKAATRTYVYVLGQIHPLLLGLPIQQGSWMTLLDAMNVSPLIADLYVDSGVELPRFEAWLTVDQDKQLIIAIPDPRPWIDLDLGAESVYMRVYSNAYYQSLRADPRVDYIKSVGMRPQNTADIIKLQSDFTKLQSLPGVVYGFVNGYKVTAIDLFTVAVQDAVEYIYDSSVFKIVDFKIRDLKTFDSLLDLKTKYLLHYAGVGDAEIDYQDDVDVWLLHTETSGRYKGVYVHRNAGDTLRMVTHKDYALTVPYLTAMQRYQADWTDTNALTVRLHIRYGGWNRPLVNENNRIKELYKLGDADLQGAMLGTASTVANWRADTLENAAYTAIMRSPVAAVDRATVETAYGYNAISKLLGDTPSPTVLSSGQLTVAVPYGLQSQSTAYEYDANGLLTGYFSHSLGSVYAARASTTVLVEMIAGKATTTLDEAYGTQATVLDPILDYRMYTCPITNGEPTNVWTDVTDTAQYVVIDGILTWMIDQTKFYTLVRSNKDFLAYSLYITPTQISDGVLRFTLSSLQTRNGVQSNYELTVPLGELDVWLNTHSLIQGVDYNVVGSEVVIISKEYLIDPANQAQHIDVRFTGHCRSDLTVQDTTKDVGFIRDQLLSANGVFNIRDDKVLRIVANGALSDRSQLKFGETDAGVATLVPMNGRPYLVRDIIVPMRGATDLDTYTMRAASQAIDAAVSAYMTLKLPEAALPSPSPIEALYELYSPFCTKLIYDLNSGVLTDPRLFEAYSTDLVLDLCQPYEWLLAFDPTQEATAVDSRFSIVHPHPLTTVIDIGIYQFKFLAMAVKQYLNNQVSLSGFLNITTY